MQCIIVSGHPGAGKTRAIGLLAQALPGQTAVILAAAAPQADIDAALLEGAAASVTVLGGRALGDVLADAGSRHDRIVIEEDPLAPLAAPAGHAVLRLGIADAVNLGANDPALAGLAAADAILIARGDVVDPAPAEALVRGIARGPIHATGSDPAGWLAAGAAAGAPPAAPPPPAAFGTWSYAGAARIRAADVDRMLEQRPAGVYRMNGILRTESGGRKIDVVGRTRQVRECRQPDDTMVVASGPRGSFREGEVALHCTEFWASGAHMLGLFGHR